MLIWLLTPLFLSDNPQGLHFRLPHRASAPNANGITVWKKTGQGTPKIQFWNNKIDPNTGSVYGWKVQSTDAKGFFPRGHSRLDVSVDIFTAWQNRGTASNKSFFASVTHSEYELQLRIYSNGRINTAFPLR